jgi:hypothetical protein
MVSGLYFKDSQNETVLRKDDAEALRFLAVLPKLKRPLFCYRSTLAAADNLFAVVQANVPSATYFSLTIGLDESLAGYCLASCSPAELASASPTIEVKTTKAKSGAHTWSNSSTLGTVRSA